jgi:hypothetical protein
MEERGEDDSSDEDFLNELLHDYKEADSILKIMRNEKMDKVANEKRAKRDNNKFKDQWGEYDEIDEK